MFFTRKEKVTVILAFVLLFSIASPIINPVTASAAKKKTYGMTKVQTDFLDKYWPIIHKLCEKSIKNGRGDSDYMEAAQIGLESGHLTSQLSRNKNNCLGVNAFSTESESAYEHARWFDSLEDCFAYHNDLMVRKYKNASKHHSDPYEFIELIASTYAPGSDDYVSDIKSLIDDYALYNAQRYWPKINEAKINIRRAKEAKRNTENEYQTYLKSVKESNASFIKSYPALTINRKAIKKIGLIDPVEAKYRRTINTINNNLKDRKAELKAARKKAYTTYHTIALGINYGRISATKENLGDSYGEIMREYKKLNS